MGKEELNRKNVRKLHPVIVCRCNDVTLEDIEKLIDEGCRDLECLRKVLRIGMGPCQGRNCIPILMRILARKLGKRVDELPLPTVRAPLTPITINILLKSVDVEGDEK